MQCYLYGRTVHPHAERVLDAGWACGGMRCQGASMVWDRQNLVRRAPSRGETECPMRRHLRAPPDRNKD